MKVTLSTMLVVGATFTNAIAIADAKVGKFKLGFCGPPGMSCPRDVATCGIPGNPCARLKRSAEAVASAFAAADNGARGWCGADGLACHKARRSILEVGEAVEDAVTGIYQREAYAAANADQTKRGLCGAPGSFCARKERREADPEAEVGKFELGFCGPPGMSCPKSKREAEAEASALAAAEVGKFKLGFCGPPGMSCPKARDAEAEAQGKFELGFRGPSGVSCPKEKRDAEASVGKFTPGFCGVPGMSCPKEKREAFAVAEADAKKKAGRFKLGFCGPPGMSCPKVRRDLDSQAFSAEDIKVARGIDSIDPEFFKRVRDAEDGEGTALRAAHAAFLQVKREAEEVEEDEMTPYELLGFCDEYQCDEESVAAILSSINDTTEKRDAEACNAVGGACDIARRQLSEIEAKLEAAVQAL